MVTKHGAVRTVVCAQRGSYTLMGKRSAGGLETARGGMEPTPEVLLVLLSAQFYTRYTNLVVCMTSAADKWHGPQPTVVCQETGGHEIDGRRLKCQTLDSTFALRVARSLVVITGGPLATSTRLCSPPSPVNPFPNSSTTFPFTALYTGSWFRCARREN